MDLSLSLHTELLAQFGTHLSMPSVKHFHYFIMKFLFPQCFESLPKGLKAQILFRQDKILSLKSTFALEIIGHLHISHQICHAHVYFAAHTQVIFPHAEFSIWLYKDSFSVGILLKPFLETNIESYNSSINETIILSKHVS